MAQITFRGNLSAKVFPFLSAQFGRTVVIQGGDQSGSGQQVGDASGGDTNTPQAYYMHNVVPTAQGYKSVGYKKILSLAGDHFEKVVPVRDPSMVRGWIGLTSDGKVYIFRAGDTAWTNITAKAALWNGKLSSVGYANGYTYLCLPGSGVFKLDVTGRTMNKVVFNGLISESIVAITSNANYLIATDGVAVYWSSTVSSEDFVPSLITGAGSGKPSNAEGLIIALMPLSTGFAVYTSVNIVIATYSQNAKFPWIFRPADNSKGIVDVQHIASGGDAGTNYAWTSAGLQKISVTGATTVLPEITDFLAGNKFEDWDEATNSLRQFSTSKPMKVKLAFVGARFLIISYGITDLTHALVYDTALKRIGKLRITHSACFDVSLNNNESQTTDAAASPKTTVGFTDIKGAVSICDFSDTANSDDSVIILGKFQLSRSRLTTLQSVSIECINEIERDFKVVIQTTLDGKNVSKLTLPTLRVQNEQYSEYSSRVTGLNHSLIFKGTFALNSFELTLTQNGRR